MLPSCTSGFHFPFYSARLSLCKFLQAERKLYTSFSKTSRQNDVCGGDASEERQPRGKITPEGKKKSATMYLIQIRKGTAIVVF